MTSKNIRPIVLAALCLFNLSAFAQAGKKAAPKAKVSVDDQWDLTGIYATEADWKAGMAGVEATLPKLAECKGHLGDSAKKLKACLDIYIDLSKQLGRVSSWSGLQVSTDRRQSANIERDQLADNLRSKAAEASAFFDPELTKLGRDKVMGLAKSAELKPYTHLLEVTLNQADHILDEGREGLLASLSPVLYGQQDVQQFLLTSDITWKTATIGGKKIKVDQSGYTKFRESPNRTERAQVFAAFYDVLGQYQRTMGAALAGSVKRNTILARTRNYPNAVSAALEREKIPQEVYRTLIAQVNEGLPAMHEYLQLQKTRMGLKKLEYYDAYAPGIKFNGKFTIQDSKRITALALAPLGDEYVQKFSKAVNERWMDVYPHDGKAGGAFMNPAVYDLHPFLMLNHQDDFNSLSTFAHEWGHAMHSVYTAANQPYMYSDYATFIAEIASTTNEILLNDYLVKHAKTAKEKAFYLEALQGMIRTTFFRQTQFGEFELALHEEIEKGGALTGQGISKIYGGIARKYYGHDKGVMNIDEKYFAEWVFVPHFYNSFYVYQYATSFSAGVYFASQILENKPGALENYLKVLKAGGSKYPYDILMDAGVDMKSPQVYQAVIARMRAATEELKKLK